MITVVPAYGRDYKTAKAARADWNTGKDFRIAAFGPDDGRYVNASDMEMVEGKIAIRYDRLTKVVLV